MNWKQQYNLIAVGLVSAIFGFLLAGFFIKPIVKISFENHCIISEIIKLPSGEMAIVYK